jgi:Resolvase, N terminal domain
VGFRSLREALDTTTPGGRLVFHLFGALAQFEREIIRDRTMAGLAAARARGRFGGRRSKLSADQRRTARKLYDERELTVAQIREGPRGQPHVDLPGARQGRGRSGGRGDRTVNAGERLVTVLVTVAVPAATDPEDAAALVADAAVSTALDVVHAVGVEGHSGCGPPGGSRRCTCPRHLPVAGSTVVPTGTGEPAAVLVVGEGTVLLRHLGGELQQEPLVALAPDPLDPANTYLRHASQDAF